jgi:hypothetical protein
MEIEIEVIMEIEIEAIMEIWSVTYFSLQDGLCHQKYFYSKNDADTFSYINGQCVGHPVLLKI